MDHQQGFYRHHEYKGHYHRLLNDREIERILPDVAAWLKEHGVGRS